jgi:hypothetical protein
MAGVRVFQLQVSEPAPPLHRPWNKNRRFGNTVAQIDAALARTLRASSNPAIPHSSVNAVAVPSCSDAFPSRDSVEAIRLTVQTTISSRSFDHGHELPARFFLRPAPLECLKGRSLIGISAIGDGAMDLRVAKATCSGDRVILAMVSSDASGR